MSLRAMFHYELHVIKSWTTFIVIPATHEKAESQSTTHMEIALKHYQCPYLPMNRYGSQALEVSMKDSKTANLLNFVIFM